MKVFQTHRWAKAGCIWRYYRVALLGWRGQRGINEPSPVPSCSPSPLALQALVQCGQPQCYSHILRWLKSEKVNPLLIDAASYIMAQIPNPSAQRLREIFKVAQERPSRITLYALSHVVNK